MISVTARRALVVAAQELSKVSAPGPEHFQAMLTAISDVYTSYTGDKCTCELVFDGRTAGTVPADPFAGQRFLNWNRSQDKPPVTVGKELGVARKVLEFAAAPTPMNSGMEEGK